MNMAFNLLVVCQVTKSLGGREESFNTFFGSQVLVGMLFLLVAMAAFLYTYLHMSLPWYNR
jgi:hypothetical protein